MTGKKEISAKYIDDALLRVGSKDGIDFCEAARSPLFDGVKYLRLWYRLSRLASVGKIRLEQKEGTGKKITYYVVEGVSER
jgi:hypothetical protein